jgi:hypothetical protein
MKNEAVGVFPTVYTPKKKNLGSISGIFVVETL